MGRAKASWRAVNDIVSFQELQVLDMVKEYQACPCLLEDVMVYDDGIIKGVIRRKDWEDEVEVCEFYVEPFFKGQGVGRELMDVFIREAKRNKKSRIFLWVIKENLSARRFYERNGFRANGMEQLIEGTDVTDMCYDMRL